MATAVGVLAAKLRPELVLRVGGYAQGGVMLFLFIASVHMGRGMAATMVAGTSMAYFVGATGFARCHLYSLAAILFAGATVFVDAGRPSPGSIHFLLMTFGAVASLALLADQTAPCNADGTSRR